MSAYDLPTSLNVGGVDFAIRSDYRAVIDVLIACSDDELDDYTKTYVMLKILYKDFESIPDDHLQEACEQAVWFIDAGGVGGTKSPHRLMDWEKDAPVIIPAINKTAHTEIRAMPYLHWWTFMSYFMEIEESLFSTIVMIRKKKAEHKKLEPHEKEFYKENIELIELKKTDKTRSEEEKKALEELWG